MIGALASAVVRDICAEAAGAQLDPQDRETLPSGDGTVRSVPDVVLLIPPVKRQAPGGNLVEAHARHLFSSRYNRNTE